MVKNWPKTAKLIGSQICPDCNEAIAQIDF